MVKDIGFDKVKKSPQHAINLTLEDKKLRFIQRFSLQATGGG